jgi:hypothetical protein
MKGHTRDREGDNEQRRREASRARAAGKKPSEVGATLGASKQRGGASANASHDERLSKRHQGKGGKAPNDDKARPGNRDRDPKRTERWR